PVDQPGPLPLWSEPLPVRATVWAGGVLPCLLGQPTPTRAETEPSHSGCPRGPTRPGDFLGGPSGAAGPRHRQGGGPPEGADRVGPGGGLVRPKSCAG